MTDKKLLEIAQQFTIGLTDGVLTQKCFMVSVPLQGFLALYGINAELVSGEVETPNFLHGHYWLELPDGRILDPTHGQFENATTQIYLGELPKNYKKGAIGETFDVGS